MQTLVGFVTFVVLLVVGLLGLQAGGQVAQAVIIVLSAGVGFAVWRAQENAKETRDLEAKIGSDKRVLYKLYLDIMREITERGGKVDSALHVGKLRRWVFNSVLIASDEVVLAHDRFLHAGKVGNDMVLPAMADVVLAMRRDAGEPSTTLRPIDVLATFIKAEDIENVSPLCEKWEKDRYKAWRLAPTRPDRRS